jgi:hypothetical protein
MNLSHARDRKIDFLENIVIPFFDVTLDSQQLESDKVLSFEIQTKLILLFSLQVSKFFKRYQFATAPIFRDELIVGNLPSIVKNVQDDILCRMEIDREVKEANSISLYH